MVPTIWTVLYKTLDTDQPYKFIDRVECDVHTELRPAVDAILKSSRILCCIEGLESRSIEIYELPELPITRRASVNQLAEAYEGLITDAYIRKDCIRLYSQDTVDEPPVLICPSPDHVPSAPRHRPLSRPLSPEQKHYDQQALWNKIASVGKRRKTPSTEGTVERLRDTQKPTVPAAIHNGRPLSLTGMPPSIYHPAFTTFLRVIHKTQKFTCEELRTARSCVEAFVAFYGSDRERAMGLKCGGLRDAAHPSADFLTQMKYALDSGTVWPDGSLRAIVPGQPLLHPPFCIVEVEAEVGRGACDPMAQAEQCYKAIYCSDEASPRHLCAHARPLYEASCCPCLLVGIAGPNIWISGAVIGDYILARPLAHISFVPQFTLEELSPNSAAIRRMAHMLRALRATTTELEDFYMGSIWAAPSTPVTTPRTKDGASRGSTPRSQNTRNTSTSAQTRPYIGPHFTTFKTKDDTKVVLKYTGRLSPEECRKAVFTALAYTDPATTQPTAVVVKFTHTYSVTAHALLVEHADEPFAPKLWFCEKVASVGMYVVVMDYLQDAQDAADRKMTTTQYASLKKAITLLHNHDLVFGDIREPNVLLSGDGLMLIDFDWCGKEGEVFYPYDINMETAIRWHPEVFPCEPIKKEHDMHMLAALGDVGEENGN